MLVFRDTNDLPLSSLSTTFESLSVNPMTLNVDCYSGFELRAENVPANLTVTGRFAGSGSYQNLSSSPLDLSAFDGTRQAVELRFTVAAVTAIEETELKLVVARP